MSSKCWYHNFLCVDVSKNSDFIKSKLKYAKKFKNLHLTKKWAKKNGSTVKNNNDMPFDGNFKIDRFEGCSAGWACNGQSESISFTVNKFVNLFGIGLYGSCERDFTRQQYEVEIEVKEEKSGLLVGTYSDVYFSSGPEPYIVRFDYSLGLFANTTYVITVRIQGPNSYKGTRGKSMVETKLLSGKKIRVDFSNAHESSGTSVKWGQIPSLIFS